MLRLLGRIILAGTLPISAVFLALAQDQDSRQVLAIDEVAIIGDRIKKKVISIQILTDGKLQILSVYLIANSIRHFFGVLIKNYTSIGRLKTINIRNMRNQYFGMFYDSIKLSNAHNDVTDLECLLLDSMESSRLNYAYSKAQDFTETGSKCHERNCGFKWLVRPSIMKLDFYLYGRRNELEVNIPGNHVRSCMYHDWTLSNTFRLKRHGDTNQY